MANTEYVKSLTLPENVRIDSPRAEAA